MAFPKDFADFCKFVLMCMPTASFPPHLFVQATSLTQAQPSRKAKGALKQKNMGPKKSAVRWTIHEIVWNDQPLQILTLYWTLDISICRCDLKPIMYTSSTTIKLSIYAFSVVKYSPLLVQRVSFENNLFIEASFLCWKNFDKTESHYFGKNLEQNGYHRVKGYKIQRQ